MWIARDANGELCLFKDKPTLYGVNFYSKCDGFNLDESLFPKVTFENSPIEVGLKTKSKLKHNYDWKEMSELNSLTESTPCILAYIDEKGRDWYNLGVYIPWENQFIYSFETKETPKYWMKLPRINID